jgi:MFS family permease
MEQRMMEGKTGQTTADARGARQQEVIFLAIVALFWFAQYVYIPYQTTYLTGIGAASSVVGTVVGAYGISQLILRLPVGVCADRLGRHKPFIMAGALASGSASLFRVCLCNERGFLAANLLSGLASAMWISFMVFYTGKYPQDQQKATSRIVLFNNLGMLLGFVASTLCYSRIGMGKICALSVGAGTLAFVLALFLKEPGGELRPGRGNLSPAQLLKVCRGKRIIMFSMIALIQQGIQLTTTMSFTNQILKNIGASNGIVGVSSILYMLSAVVFAAMASSDFCTKKGPRFWIPAVLLAVAFYCLMVPAAGSIPFLLALQVLPGMATGILFSYATSEAMQGVPGEQRSTAMGFFQAVYAVGMTTFPIVTGKIAAGAGMRQGYLVLAVIAVAGSGAAALYYMVENGKFLEIIHKS